MHLLFPLPSTRAPIIGSPDVSLNYALIACSETLDKWMISGQYLWQGFSQAKGETSYLTGSALKRAK